MNITKSSGSWGWFWITTAIPLILMLYTAQLYSIFVLFILGKRTKQSEEEDNSISPEDMSAGRRSRSRQSSLVLLEGVENSLKTANEIAIRMGGRFSFVQGGVLVVEPQDGRGGQKQSPSSTIPKTSDEELGAPIDSSSEKS